MGGRFMTILKFAAAALGLTLLATLPANAWKRGPVNVLVTLPFATGSVEGLTVGPEGNIYVPTFGFNANGAIAGSATLFVISPNNGKIVRQMTIAGSSSMILGLRFNPVNQHLIVLDFGAAKILDVNPNTGTNSLLAGPIPGAGLNALTFDGSGNAYVSDSFLGKIYKVTMAGGLTTWSSSPLLGPGTGLTPPFGANGVEFSNDGNTLFVANTAFHQIIQIPVIPPMTPGGLPTAG